MAQKTLLMILDGWGNAPDPKVSALDQAQTPYIDSLYKNYASNTLRTDGLYVGFARRSNGKQRSRPHEFRCRKNCISRFSKNKSGS